MPLTLLSCFNSEAYKAFEGSLIELLCNPLEGWFKNSNREYEVNCVSGFSHLKYLIIGN